MIGWRRTTACERASQWISLRLDGELSELERAALDRHLERCARCRELGAELGGLTAVLRSAPLAEPGRAVVLPASRRQRARIAGRIGFVTAVAGMGAAIVALISTSSPTDLLGGSPRALAFSSRHEQITFVHNKYRQMEPLRAEALAVAAAAAVPPNSRRALR